MTTIEFLEKCIRSAEVKSRVKLAGRNSSDWHCIECCINDVTEDGGDINKVADYLDNWLDCSIDEHLAYCSPEFIELIEVA